MCDIAQLAGLFSVSVASERVIGERAVVMFKEQCVPHIRNTQREVLYRLRKQAWGKSD